jgi:hypothetical protein
MEMAISSKHQPAKSARTTEGEEVGPTAGNQARNFLAQICAKPGPNAGLEMPFASSVKECRRNLA